MKNMAFPITSATFYEFHDFITSTRRLYPAFRFTHFVPALLEMYTVLCHPKSHK